MKRFILAGLIALAASGCALPMPNGTVVRIPPLSQIGASVRVLNNCAPILDIESVGGLIVVGLPYSGSHTVWLESAAFSGSHREMTLIVKGYSADRRVYLGSAQKTFTVNIHQGSRAEAWEINQLRLPGRYHRCI